jgi:putative transposase
MCRTLKVSKSGFYGWQDRAPSARAKSDAALSEKEKIVGIHKDSRESYGAPRVHFELRTLGVRCARKRVARLMREALACSGAVDAEGKSAPPSAHAPSALLLLQT